MSESATILKNPSERLRSPRAGDLSTLKYLAESTPPAQIRGALLRAYNLGHGASRDRLRNQRIELRRLNRVIQQMSWKLHVKRRRAWAEAFHPDPFSPVVIGGVTTAVLLLIVAVLMFS